MNPHRRKATGALGPAGPVTGPVRVGGSEAGRPGQ
jgi:hypothetical protein